MIRILLVMETEDELEAEAMERLDTFREKVKPAWKHGITLYRATTQDLRECPFIHAFSTTSDLVPAWGGKDV